MVSGACIETCGITRLTSSHTFPVPPRCCSDTLALLFLMLVLMTMGGAIIQDAKTMANIMAASVCVAVLCILFLALYSVIVG